MKLATWSIVNNEIDFISDVIDHHKSWVDHLYVLDTGSTDGTLEFLQEKAKTISGLVVEEYHTKYIPEYDIPWEHMSNPFPEVEVRNYAINRCKEILKPDWLIQLDGDEIFLKEVKDVIFANEKAVALNHSTINPACSLTSHRKEFRFGHDFYDPHCRVWNAKYAIEYMRNEKMGDKQFHCNPTIKGWNKHLFEIPGTVWVKNNFHIHLHWLYGKKMETFFNKSGIYTKSQMVSNSPLNTFNKLLPSIFAEKRKKWEMNQ